mmetsp:Transcript_100204/g.251222  ORF Transcript_100204/g.251222 Transcript_100204/m.251222 type:complete len:406 (-) Transcript_100204:128-1345(-)
MMASNGIYVSTAPAAPPSVPSVPRTLTAAQPATAPPASFFDTTSSTVAGFASVCGLLVAVGSAARRGIGHRRQSSRVQLRGASRAPFKEPYNFRAKPGDKYTYRCPQDFNSPEFGVWPPEAPDRVVKYGQVHFKGKPVGESEFYAKKEAEKQLDKDRLSGNSSDSRGALLLDCDGTIVETERDGHRVAFNQAFKELGYDCEWEVGLYGELLTTGGGKERMTRYFTDYNPEAWPHEEPAAKDNPKIMELHELKTKLFMEIVRSGQLPLREGIEDLITDAFANGWKVGVCSTSNEQAVRAVVETLLPEFAPEIPIFAGDIVSKKKPDPEIYNLAAKEMGVAPMTCVVIEDASIGCSAAKAAGMQVIVTKSIYTEDEDFEGADEIVSSAAEIDFEEDVVAMLPTLQMS